MLNTKVLADLSGALTRSYEQAIYPELARAPQIRIRGKEINVGEIQNVAHRRAGRHRETTAAPSRRGRKGSARRAARGSTATPRARASEAGRACSAGQQRTPSAWRRNKLPVTRPKKQSEK